MLLHHSTYASIDSQIFWGVVQDFSSYPSFMPMVKSVEILKDSENVWEVQFSILMIRSLQYSAKLERISANELQWNLIQGDFQQNTGKWSVQKEGQGIRIEYDIQMTLKTFMPATIRHSLEKVWLPNMVKSFIQETERRQSLPKIDRPDS